MMHLNLLHNPKLKAMALLLAVLSWGVVKQITNNDKTIDNIPVQIRLPEGWAIREIEQNEVRITFRGTREALLLLDERTVQVTLDLRESDFTSRKTIEIEPRQVTYTGSSARIVEIEPPTLEIQLGMEGRKQLPVVVNRSGEPPEGLQVESITATPQLVTLYGAQELLENITSLQTAPLTLSDKVQSFEQRLDVLPPSEEWVGLIDPPRVRVRVGLAGLVEERTFEDIPILLYHPAGEPPPGRRNVEPDTVDVFLQGSPQLLDNLDIAKIRAFVSAEEAAADSGEHAVRVLAPPGVAVLGVRPPTVRLRRPPPTPTPSPTPTPVPATPTPTPDDPEETP